MPKPAGASDLGWRFELYHMAWPTGLAGLLIFADPLFFVLAVFAIAFVAVWQA